jgi:hypothetical protein
MKKKPRVENLVQLSLVSKAEKDNKITWIGAVKGAVEGNFGAVKGPEGAVI